MLPRLDLPSAQKIVQQLIAIGSTFDATENNALQRLWIVATEVGNKLIGMTAETLTHSLADLNAYGLKNPRQNILFSSSHIALFTWKLLTVPTTEPAERHIVTVVDVFKCIARRHERNDSPESYEFQYIEPTSLDAISLAAVVHQHPAVLAVLLDPAQDFHQDCKDTLLERRSLCYSVEPFDRDYDDEPECGMTLNISTYVGLLKDRLNVMISATDAGLSFHTLLLAHILSSIHKTLHQFKKSEVTSYIMSLDKECTIDLTAFQHAILSGNSAIVDLLLNHPGLVVDKFDGGNMTALCYAIYLGNRPVVETLIRLGSDVNVSTKHFRREHSELTRHSEDDWRPIHLAAVADDPNLLQLLLDHGADVDISAAPSEILSLPQGTTGTTALHLAAKDKSSKTLSTLLKANANVHLLDRYARTPLHLAALHHSESAASALLKAGAKVDMKDSHGQGLDLKFMEHDVTVTQVIN
jgi:hypothetical protein